LIIRSDGRKEPKTGGGGSGDCLKRPKNVILTEKLKALENQLTAGPNESTTTRHGKGNLWGGGGVKDGKLLVREGFLQVRQALVVRKGILGKPMEEKKEDGSVEGVNSSSSTKKKARK